MAAAERTPVIDALCPRELGLNKDPIIKQDLPGFRHCFALFISAEWSRDGTYVSLGPAGAMPSLMADTEN